ncbi:NAD-dependent epimerase/dehydratase family protein [Sphingobacterium wenxiniae]|uniref:Nucleoside-diphosphate-sugar epimerase n=1 Tax=Sphingobacterium wenxiniae TaxID=683125 RepID=A0A1I6V9A1_9SPHI|nr:NAD(P)-dependent oxidoreductase [Sphingobacterium wenxiniae]SFT10246.1 Nucleoside-diphosphate-sugar epimerase [Sphingobacterium wenxiniae]
MSKKILITGASGFVGSHLVELAFQSGFEVHAAVRQSSDVNSIRPFVHKFIYPDFKNLTNLRQLFDEEGYVYVVHAAAMTKSKTEEAMWEVNVGHTERLIQAAFSSLNMPQRVVFVSSLAAIGPVGYEDALIDESSPYRPVTVYGRSKKAAEEMLRSKFADKPITVIRPTAVYGPREKDLFILFDTMNKGVDAYVGKAPQKLSFIYVKDLVEVLLNACFASQSGYCTFNITDGQVYSRYAMAEAFKESQGKKLLRIHVPYVVVEKAAVFSQWLYKGSKKTPVLYPERLNELTAQNWGCDITAAKTVLGFSPQYDLRKGMQESLLWYKENNWL